MVTTDIAVDAAIITVGAEGVVIITDGTEAVVTVTGRPLSPWRGVCIPFEIEECRSQLEESQGGPLALAY